MAPDVTLIEGPRILIVDDHAGFRAQAHRLLVDEGLNVVGEAEDGDSCLAAIERLHPDLVVLDVQLPGDDGFAVAQRIASDPAAPVVVLTSSRAIEDIESRLATSPAAAFVEKAALSGARLRDLLGSKPRVARPS